MAYGILAGCLALASAFAVIAGPPVQAQEAAAPQEPPAGQPVPGAEPPPTQQDQASPPAPQAHTLSGEQLAAIRKRISVANNQTANILNELSSLDARIFAINQTIVDAGRQAADLELKIQEGGDDVEQLERRREELKNSWTQRARRSYKDTPGTAWAPLFSAETWADVGRLKKLWVSLAHSHTKLVEDSAKIRDRLAAEKAQLLAASESLLKRSRELNALRENLRQARQSRTAALGRLRLSIGQAMVAQQATLAADAVGMRIPHLCSPGSPVQDQRLADLLDWYAPATGAEPFLPPKMSPSGIVLTVESSWYGPTFEGCRASSGATYRSNQMTAASLTLPFGTLLRVGHAGKSAVVVITDRGPYVAGRELDLSHAAAQAIGLPGVGQVTIEILLPTEPPPPFP